MSELPIRRLETPTPYAVGPVNAYLVEAAPLTLVDSGISSPEARDLLFELIGDDLARIERILVTHGHPDHYGLMHDVADACGATIYFPERELVRFTAGGMLEQWGRLLIAQGMPMELLLEMDRQRRKDPRPKVRADEVTTIADGDRFEFEGFTLLALHNPGHTGGHMVFYEPQSKTLLAGDQLLPRVSPNPLLEPSFEDGVERRRSLVEYLASLETLLALDLALSYPGHGDPVTAPTALIERTIAHHMKRKGQVAKALTNGPVTPYELARTLYPRVKGYDTFLAVSEVVAHLDLVVADGHAEVADDEGVARYHSAG